MAPLSKELTNQQLAEHFEAQVAKGIIAPVASGLRKIEVKAIPVPLVLRFANLARRAGLPVQSLRILSRTVQWISGRITGSDEERAAYAASLIRLGALPEAERILATVKSDRVLEGLLYGAFARFAVWEYAEAIPLLEQYVESTHRKGLAAKSLVGKMNLAAAYVHERQTAPATALLAELREATKREGWIGYYGNCLEISAQLAVATKSWSEAQEWLDEAYRALRLKGGSDLFFVSKWRGILELEKKQDTASIKNISVLKDEAAQMGLWENVRDLDLALVSAVNDNAIFAHLYFGTPASGFRKHLFRSTRKKFSPPEYYEWKTGPAFRSVDIAQLPLWNQSRRLLSLLCSDFYRPFRVTDIFASLHAEEYFNPFSSAGRIHQAMRLLRQEMKRMDIPISISCRSGGYRVVPPAGVSLRVSRRTESQSYLDPLAEMSGGSFSSKEAAAYLKLPLRTLQRYLKEEVMKGNLEISGRSQSSRFSIKKK